MTLRARATRVVPFLRDEAASIAAMTALLITLCLVLTVAIRSPLKDDVAWLLYVARKWLAGQRLYEDLIEVNPPLIVWIYALPAGLANWLGAAPKLIAAPFFAALVLGSAWWSACLLQGRSPLFARRVPVFAVIGIALLGMPGVEFGQREHLLVAAALPYLCLFARELDGEREPRLNAALAGLVAGLGCALKPTYVLAFVLMELIAALRGRRPVRAATIAAAGAMGAYGLGVLLFCPAFMEKAVPLALALYGGTDTPYWQILAESSRLLFGQVVIVLLCWSSSTTLARRSPFLRHLLLALTAFAIGTTVVFVMQGKNWFYHRLPATTTTILALLLWSAAVLPRRPFAALSGLTWARARDLVPVPLVLASLVAFAISDYDRMKPWVEAAVEPETSTEVKLERLVRKEKARTYIAFSEWIALGFPVVNNTGVAWASRFDSMWALKGELWRARQDGTAPKEWPIRRWIARDFVAGCPDLAVVDTREGINYVGVLVASDNAFAQAWSHYRQIAAFDGLRVLKRDGNSCTSVPPLRRATLQHLSAAAMEPP
ncbi:hypothetical protein [Limobrevibacterium gyesilva]|uniref:Uncharacterized protein n=1 Tax=Limobrevibacterium gyesilva TaxID=2991712 RepID=A0AA41YWU7_9PROT|nr:hypothetical protein [Limobrevibacterium gyesilva]MCW3476817.1 hypothetical protein [Limobrevibacterium gyesilva]